MWDCVSGLDAIGVDYSVALEAVTTEGVKLQFPASGQMLIERPDKFRITRTGGHSDIELVSDGETVTLHGRKVNAYAQNETPEWLDAFVNKAREERGVELVRPSRGRAGCARTLPRGAARQCNQWLR